LQKIGEQLVSTKTKTLFLAKLGHIICPVHSAKTTKALLKSKAFVVLANLQIISG
jgi:hypothetical protein